MKREGYVDFDIGVLDNKQVKYVSSNEALSDIIPVQWSEDVLSGKNKL